MAEVAADELVQADGVGAEEIKTDAMEEGAASLDGDQPAVESAQNGAPADDTTGEMIPKESTVEHIEVKQTEEAGASEEQQSTEAAESAINGAMPQAQNGEILTSMETSEIGAAEAMEQAVEEVEAEAELINKEVKLETEPTGGAETEEGKSTQAVEEERAEEQALEDRTEDQVPDITGTDNADVMATSMDGIEEIPTSDELQQGTEAPAAAEEAVHPPDEAETKHVEEAAPAAEVPSADEVAASEAPSADEVVVAAAAAETVTAEAGATQKVNEDEAIQSVNETEMIPTEKEQAGATAPEINAIAEAEGKKAQNLEQVKPEVEEALEGMEHNETTEVAEMKEEVIAMQSSAIDTSSAIAEEESTEGAKEDEFDSKHMRTSSNLDNVETLPEEAIETLKEQPPEEKIELQTLETTEISEESTATKKAQAPPKKPTKGKKAHAAEENSTSSAPQSAPIDEQSETSRSEGAIQSPQTPSTKTEEEESALMATSQETKEEFASEEMKPSSRKTSAVEEKVSSRKTSATEKIPSRKTSKAEEKVPSRKSSAVEEKVLPSNVSDVEEKVPSRKTSGVEENVPSRKTSAVEEEKTPSRKASEIEEEKIPSKKASVVEEEKIPSRKSSAEEKAPSRKESEEVKEKIPSRKTSKSTRFEEEAPKSPPKSPRMPRSLRTGRTKETKAEVSEEKVELEHEPSGESEPATENATTGVEEAASVAEVPAMEEHKEEVTEEAPSEGVDEGLKLIPVTGEGEEIEEHITEEKKSPPAVDRVTASPPHRRSPSPVRKRPERSPSPVRRQTKAAPPTSTYTPYDQDTYRPRGPPPRMPSYSSFSSHIPVEKATYSPISPWIQDAAHKYRNEYTATSTYRPPSTYTSMFDDIVSSGPFASSLYSASRLLERSRSRSRELRNALRSNRSASNYYRYTSNYATPPIRTRDYSTPPLSSVHRAPSRSGSFISFMDYSGQKQYELARSSSRFSPFEGLSHASSRSNFDMFYDTGRLSRVDSYIRDMDRHVEHEFPSAYAKYRSPSRPYLPQEYTPVNGYRTYSNPSSLERSSSFFTKRYTYDVAPMVRSMYESRIVDLERSLSRERLARDRMKAKYTTLSHKLEQACRQMDLLRTNSYSSIRGGTGTYSVYSHNYPYF